MTTAKLWNTQWPESTALSARYNLRWPVIPLDSDKKPVKIGGQHEDGTPKRLSWKAYQERLSTEQEIRSWQKKYNPSAWAVVTGKKSNVVLLDFDGDTGRKTMEDLGLSPHVRTGSGGSHIYFEHPGWHVPTLNSKSKKEMGQRWPGLDIRADGGYAAFCGRNEQGQYTWLRDFQPEKLDILPDDLRTFLGLMYSPDEAKARQEQATRSTRVEGEKLLKWALDRLGPNLGRNDGGFDLACQLRDNHFSESEATPVMLEYARRVSPMSAKGLFEPYTDEEALASLKSAYTGTARQPWESTLPHEPVHFQANGNSNGSGPAPTNAHSSFNLTDLGNAERFAAQYHTQVRWCETWNSWLIFNGKYWKQDQSGRVDQLAKKTVRSILIEAANEPDKERYKLLLKHAVASESNRAIRALLDRAKSELPATPDQFNTHLHLLNCKNGTLDLHTGELRPHTYADMLTRCLKINYNPLAPCPKWLQFITSIFAGNQSLTDFMQQALGMSLSGDVSEQCLFIGHGGGSNGKTTLFETVRIILGEYGLAANIETFQMRKGERINNDVAELYGARFVTADENTQGSRLNEAFIKKATGKQPLRARRLHENEFQFMPEFTIWFAVNHKPVVKDTSKGMWRRVHFIPFNVTIEGDQVDKHLVEKLLEEAEGVLAWLVQGCIAWYQRGQLIVPQIVQDATQAYRAEMDVVARFLAECCEQHADQEIGATVLYQAYKTWCDETGERWEPQKNFGARLTERGYERQKNRNGWIYRGIKLQDVTDVTDVTDKTDNFSRREETSQKTANYPSHPSHPSQNEPNIGRIIAQMTAQGYGYPKKCSNSSHQGVTRWLPRQNPDTGKWDSWYCCKCEPAEKRVPA